MKSSEFVCYSVKWFVIELKKDKTNNCDLTMTKATLFLFLRDRFRTTVNVLGDSIGAGVVEHLSRDDLLKYDVNGKVDDRVPLSNGGKLDDPDQLLVTSSL